MARILLVDDDVSVLEALRRVLERLGHEVVEARDGTEGFRVYTNEPADVVLTDLIMPGTEGVELIQELRLYDPKARIIAMSGGGQIEARNLLNIARHLGADRVLAKPFGEKQLNALLVELLASG